MTTRTTPAAGPDARGRLRSAARHACARSARPGLRDGFSIVEVLVAMTILLTGIVVVLSFFPMSLRQNQRAIDASFAAYLAQMKAEEIRRDNATDPTNLIDQIKTMTVPSLPLTFPTNPRFAYSFSGLSLLSPSVAPGTARVIVRYSQTFRPQQEILYELAFDK